MDLMSIIGLLLSFIAIFGGMVIKGAPISSLANPAAFMIIILGTASAVMIATPGHTLKKFGKLLGIAFKNQKESFTKPELIELFVSWAQDVRKNGLLALESKLEEIDDPFLKRTMKNVIDGISADNIREIAETEIDAIEHRHEKGAQIFVQSGTYAPTLGVLGAVIGLVAALGNLGDIDKLGHAIAGAFIATLLGIYTGYVFAHPIANKLKQKSKHEIEMKNMVLEACMLIQSGAIPSLVEKKLLAMLSETERQAVSKKKEEGN